VDAIDAFGAGLMTGLRFGQWVAWGGGLDSPGGDHLYEIVFAHRDRGWAVRMPIHNSGWFDYRSSSGSWFTCYSDGDIRPDSGHDWAKRIFRRKPDRNWPDRVALTAGDWTFSPEPHRLVLRNGVSPSWVALYRDRPLFTFAKKPLRGCTG
jgi:hypothetical protein